MNQQVNMEFNSFYSYLSMAAYFQSRYMPGSASWFKLQANEEYHHARKINSYILSRGGKIVLTAIEAPETEWKSCLSVFEEAYAQELKVSVSINALMDLAKSEHDHATEIMLQWFVTEQVEEEDTAKTNIEKFKFVKDNSEGIIEFDHALGTRKEE